MGRTPVQCMFDVTMPTSLASTLLASTANPNLPKPSIPFRPSPEAGAAPVMATPVRPIHPRLEATELPRQPPALTVDLLREIFLCIASPADLARASTACVSFRRLIAEPTFLRRYRSLHPPLILGFLNSEPPFRFHPAEGPFKHLLPAICGRWHIRDVRDGRVLFGLIVPVHGLPDLAVCDTLSRRYLPLPPIPDDQVQARYFNAVFTPSADGDDEASFGVISVMHCATKSVVLVFNSASGSWSVGTSIRWDALGLSGLTGCPILLWPCYAYGYFYWKIHLMNKLLKLNNLNRMEFFTVDLPPDHDERCIVVVEAGEGRHGMFSHSNHDTFLNYYTSMQNEGQRAIEWQMKNIIPLPVLDPYLIGAPQGQGYIFLLGDPKVQDAVGTACFSLDIKILKIERVSQMRFSYFYGLLYFGFPPSMSARWI